jgi:hypothetical protein
LRKVFDVPTVLRIREVVMGDFFYVSWYLLNKQKYLRCFCA